MTARTVLVVDDDDSIREIAEIALQLVGGLQVQTASGGVEALEQVRAHHPDAVLMDVMMPDMDGYQATAEIRRREHGSRRTPIIALTAGVGEGERERCLEAGMDDFLTKPMSRGSVSTALEQWVSVR